MRVGIGFFVTGYTVDPLTFARAVEEAGFDSVWVPDHTVLPVNPSTPYRGSADGIIPPLYGEMADPFVLLAYMGAVTTNLKLATGITLIPERHPLTLAKAVSTLDNFSKGRVVLGIGTGWLPEETALYGVDFQKKWAYTRESVLAMKALWRDGTASFDGKYVSFPEVRCDPLPFRRPWPPVLLGAAGTELTFRRIAAWGDGWLPVMPSVDEVRAGRAAITRECEAIGRNPDEIQITVYVMDVTPETQEAYEEAGADRIVIGIWNHPGTPLPYERWREVRSQALAGPTPSAEATMNTLQAVYEMATRR